jgi:hypothetical protein
MRVVGPGSLGFWSVAVVRSVAVVGGVAIRYGVLVVRGVELVLGVAVVREVAVVWGVGSWLLVASGGRPGVAAGDLPWRGGRMLWLALGLTL